MQPKIKPLVKSGIILGIGLGGFLDGIIFHQILQLHAMLSAKVPKDTVTNIQVNMFWDGVFHAITWVCTVIGVVLLFKAGKKQNAIWNGKLLCSAMLFGWGMFNLVEGIINHHILHLHMSLRPWANQFTITHS